MSSEFYDNIQKSISSLSSKKQCENFSEKCDTWDNKNYIIRCPNCSNIALLNMDIKENYFCVKCENQHKNEYKSFNEFRENISKNFNNILCHECQTNFDKNNIFRCNICFLFLCKNCLQNHKESINHNNSIELSKIDTFCYKHNMENKYYKNKEGLHICENCYKEDINNNYILSNLNYLEIKKFFPKKKFIKIQMSKINDMIKKYQSLIKLINKWKNELDENIKILNDSLKNFYLLKKNVLENLNDENNYEYYKNNLNVIINYEMLIQKNDLDKFINSSNNYINLNYKNNLINFVDKGKIFLEIINNFNNINIKVNYTEIKKDIINKNQQIFGKEEIINFNNKVMSKYEFKTQINSFILINKYKNIIIGTDSGEIQIYEFVKTEKNDIFDLQKKLRIDEFENGIKFMIEIDENIFASLDKENNIKIIQLNNDISKYSIIQTIKINEINNKINSIIFLPILSYCKNSHYFCAGDDKNIKIWKSNKKPKNLELLIKNYQDIIQNNCINNEDNLIKDDNNELLSFELIKDIQINTLAHSLIEVDENYIASACINSQTIKFFDVNNDFNLIKEIDKIEASDGNYIMTLSNDRNILIVGCKKGFCLISVDNFQIVFKNDFNFKVLSLDIFDNNIIVCSFYNSEKNTKSIRLYKLSASTFDLRKLTSHYKNIDNEIWNLKSFDKKILFVINSDLYVLY